MASRFIGALSQHDSDDHMMQARLSNADAIDRTVPVLAADAPIFSAIEKMIQFNVESLAVVGDEKQYKNSVYILDILACLRYLAMLQRMRSAQNTQEVRLVDLFSRKGSALPSDKMLETFMGSAQDIMEENVVSIVAGSTIGEAMALMERAKRHTLVVVDDDGNLRGITTSTEIQMALPPLVRKSGRQNVAPGSIFKVNTEETTETRQAKAEKVAAVTQTGIRRVSSSQAVGPLIEALLMPDATTIPVVDSGNVIRGIIERWELAKAFLALGGVVKKQSLF